MGAVPEFWRVFGGGIFATLALGLLTAFSTLNANLAELRRDLADLQTARAGYVSSADFDRDLRDAGDALDRIEGVPARGSDHDRGTDAL